MLNIILGVCDNPCATFTLPIIWFLKFLLVITVVPRESEKKSAHAFFCARGWGWGVVEVVTG